MTKEELKTAEDRLREKLTPLYDGMLRTTHKNLWDDIMSTMKEVEEQAVRYALSEAAEKATLTQSHPWVDSARRIYIDANSILSLEEKILNDLK